MRNLVGAVVIAVAAASAGAPGSKALFGEETRQPSAEQSAVTVCAFGDPQAVTWNMPQPSEGFQKMGRSLFSRCAEFKPDAILVAGDLVSDGRQETSYRHIFRMLADAGIYAPSDPNPRFFPVPGDHDLTDNAQTDEDVRQRIHAWKQRWANLPGEKLYYSFDRGNVHFVALSTRTDDEKYAPKPGGAEFRWLAADLEATRKNPKTDWIMAYWHQPPAEVDAGGSNGWKEPELMETLEKCGVDLVLNGHQHVYHRTCPVVVTQEKNANGVRKVAVDHEKGVVYLLASWGDKDVREGAPFPYHAMAVSRSNASTVPGYKGLPLLKLTFTGKRMQGEAVNAEDGSVFDRFAIDKSGAKRSWTGFPTR